MSKFCMICNNYADLIFSKKGTPYYQCTSCKTVFSEPLDNDNKVGGDKEEQRNKEQNHLRISRVSEITLGKKHEQVRILDFGCGHGLLVKDFKEMGYTNTDGYDAFNPDFNKLPAKESYDIVTMIEVIEHTSHPFFELDVINRALVRGGFLMVETSFVDIAVQENIPLDEFFYIEPEVGHSTIFSHHGIDVLMCKKGFNPLLHIDRNVRLYRKK